MSYESQLRSSYASAHKRLIGSPPKPKYKLKLVKTIPLPPEPPAEIIEVKVIPKLPTIKLGLTLRHILAFISDREGVTVGQLKGAARHKKVARARHVFTYLARLYGGFTFSELGRFLGDRDHTTIGSGFWKISYLRELDIELNDLLKAYETELKKIWGQSGDNLCKTCPFAK